MIFAKRSAGIILSFWMSALMALTMPGVLVAIHTGTETGFINRWADSFLIAFLVAFPATLGISPIARRLTNTLIRT